MTSIVTPRLDNSLPSTPSSEWARSTVDTALRSGSPLQRANNTYFPPSSGAADGATIPGSHTPPIQTTTNTMPLTAPPPAPAGAANASVASTPGVDVPGAFPKEEGGGSLSGVMDSARQYLPDQNTLKQAGETARSYLPAGLASYMRESPSEIFSRLSPDCASAGTGTTSLPSAEKEGVKPGEHHDGVGPLPGSISETSVARLPDERMGVASGDRVGPATRQAEFGAGAIGAGVVSAAPASAAPASAAPASLPSQEQTGTQPGEHYGGVGPLPGTSSETSVAKFPDELSGKTSGERFDNKGIASSFGELGIKSQGTQVRKVDSDSRPVERVPEHDDRWADMKKSAESPADAKIREEEKRKEEERKKEIEEVAANKGKAGNKVQNDGVGHPSAKQHTQPTHVDDNNAPSPDTIGGHGHQKKRSSSESEASDHKKATVMDKVKGEVKVLLGKASRNKDKVEEGEKMKHGTN
ncbi:hypothetical protein BC834DRAFT_131866 [Gloeopeniophorella convolvens]|nr:hypothetical protein BC834DRAFT_131866 [Gloeopeniophorella convolvens]